MGLSLAERAKIKSELAARGQYWTDLQIEQYAKQMENMEPPVQSGLLNQKVYEEPPSAPGGIGENILDAVGSTVWNALDTGTMGLAGWGLKTVAPKTHDWMMEELHDTTGGRLGAAVGGLAGFMVPMGAVAKGTSLLARSITGARQAKKLAAGAKVAKPTTRILQEQAARKIQSEVLRTQGKKITLQEAKEIAINSSDDIIGFSQKGQPWYKKIMGRGKAYEMELGQGAVNAARTNLQKMMPERLAAGLSKKGIRLGSDDLVKLSDDVADMLGKRSYNSLETILAGNYSGRVMNPLMNVVGAFAQEAVNFAVVGTAMDIVQHAKGDYNPYEQRNFFEQTLHHTFFGGLFGPIKFIPGGRNQKLWSDVTKAWGGKTKRLNDSVKKMSLDDTKAFANMTMTNDKGALFVVNNRTLTLNDLKKGRGIKENELQALKKSIINHNNTQLKHFRDKFNPLTGGEAFKDLWYSLPRMTAGSLVFNAPQLFGDEAQRHHFMGMHPGEMAFHMGLGAVMSKSGRALIRGKDKKFLGRQFGEKDYYYDADLAEISQQMDRTFFTGESIGDIVKQFDGNLWTDLMERNPIQDVENIIDILKDENIVYSKDDTGLLTADQYRESALKNRELLNLLDPIVPILRSRNIEMNPNVTKKELADVLKRIKNTKSEALSTKDGDMYLNSRRNILESIYEGSSQKWTEIQESLFEVFRQQMGILTGDADFVMSDGRMHDFFLNPDGRTKEQQIAIRKLEDLKVLFKDMDIIKVQDIAIGKEKGFNVELDDAKLEQLIDLQDRFELEMSREFYGDNTQNPIELTDRSMWANLYTLDYHKNVSRVHDIMLSEGKSIPGLEEVDIRAIRSLMHEVLSHKDNAQTDIIAESPAKIKLDPEGMESAEEYQMLKDFLDNIWAISNAGGKKPIGGTIHGRDVTVPIEKVRALKEKLVRVGMPNPENHAMGLDSRMQTWVEKAIDKGIDNVMSDAGINMHPIKAEAVKRLLMNGIIAHSTGKDGRTLGLQAPMDLTTDQIRRILGEGATESQIKEIQDAYDSVMNDLGDKLVARRQDFGLTTITADQLSSIITAKHLLEPAKAKEAIEADQSDVAIKILDIEDDIKVLNDQIMQGSELNTDTPIAELKAMLNVKRNVLAEYKNIQLSWHNIYAGGVEMSRASAHLYHNSNLKSPEGRTTSEILTLMNGETDIKNLPTLSNELRNLQVAIANKVAERADVRSWFDRRQEAEARYQQEEVQGRIPDANNTMSPDSFLEKYNRNITDIFKAGEEGQGITYENGSHAMYEYYNKNGITKFRDRLFELANTTPKKAPKELRNEIMTIAKLFERRFTIKRLSLDLENGKGIFENSEISKGFLTDLFSDVFEGTAGDMILLSPDFFQNGRIQNIATNQLALSQISTALSANNFTAIVKHGAVTNMKYMKDGVVTPVNAGKDYYSNIDLDAQFIDGAHYVIGVDENINIVVPEAGFNKLADNFVKWYERVVDSDYVKNARKITGADNLFKELEITYNELMEIRSENNFYDPVLFKNKKTARKHEAMEDSMFQMFNVMYGEKIDGDWLQDAYIDAATGAKGYKYKRLAQNQGYSRNSNTKRNILKEVYKGVNNREINRLIKKYTDKEFVNTVIIDDGETSNSGEDANGIITDNRSIAEARLEAMKDSISPEAYESQKKLLRESESINAEAVNGMTAVSRDFLDYLLLLDGQENLIGSSSGQKPVGLSSYTDANGKIHVYYNKTHYFYDSNLDSFFKKNRDIDMVAFTSGTKKNKIIDPSDPNLNNQFKPISDLPSIDDGINLTDFVNGLRIKGGDDGVMPVKFDDNLAGTIYGKPKGAKVMKQFDNWTSRKVQKDLYEWARMDIAENFAATTIQLYSPENVGEASREARSFIGKGNQDGSISVESPNASTAAIWIEGGGVPFSEMSKNLYDALIKRRYIDDAGVFDGYTDAGGTPVLRGNLDGDLNIPIYDGNRQVKLGEANVTSDYLDRVIHFKGRFGAITGGKSRLRARERYKEKSSLTISFALKNDKGGRDIIIDMATEQLTDPYNNKGKIGDAEYKAINKMVQSIKKQLGPDNRPPMKEVATWRDVFNLLELNNKEGGEYEGAQLAVMAMPAPRTGPHDAMVVKVKKLLDPKDGGLMELNSYDVTMRGQRDYDTDKLPFYMDTPYSAMSEAYLSNGRIKEPTPISDPTSVTKPIDFDIYNNRSYKDHNQKINIYKRLRGPVIKMQRKLTYAQRIIGDGIDLGDGRKIIFTDNTDKALQRLVDDSQNILDIYNGVPNMIGDITNWGRKTLFENSQKSDTHISIDGDSPFFQILDGDTRTTIQSEGEKLIVEKILNDFGRLLQTESNIYEAGEAVSPRYQDMVEMYRDFKHEYSSKEEVVNWNFYHYLVKRGQQGSADVIFFGDGKGGVNANNKKNGNIAPVMSNIAKTILEAPTPFLKSLDTVTKNDYLRARETYGKGGLDYFNNGVQALIGKNRAQALELFRMDESAMSSKQFDAKNNLINDMWTQFEAARTHEQMIIQANNIESEIRRTESKLLKEQQKQQPDEAYIETISENLLIKNTALDMLMNKMDIKPDENGNPIHGQTFIRWKKGEDNTVSDRFNDMVIRDAKSGRIIKTLQPGQTWELNANQIAVKDPVIVKPVVEHDLIDGTALYMSVAGRYSSVHEVDMPRFRNIVFETRKAIRKSASNIMKGNKYRDWSEHSTKTQEAIDRGIEKIINLAMETASMDNTIDANPLGQLPSDKQTYIFDFLLSLLHPDYKGNKNVFHYSPKTGNFMPAVNKPSKSVITAVMNSIERYQAVPNYKQFVTELAQVHRGFYEALVAGRGFHDGMNRLSESNFEGALMNSTLGKVMNNTFMSKKDYRSLDDTFDAMPPILSDYAELYRQMLQDGALSDPLTAFNLRKQIIESKDPGLGLDAYNRIFQQARGELVLDSFGALQVGVGKGEGQLLGEVLMNRADHKRRQITGSKASKKGSSIMDIVDTVTSRENESREKCDF